MLARAVRKHGRTLRRAAKERPEADFPSRDDRPPLKIALLSV